MQEVADLNFKRKRKAEIVRSLVKSKNRRKVLEYLCKTQELHYLEEIVKATNLSHYNVLGAIFGNKKDYSENLSLNSLGLIEVMEINGYKYYTATELGLTTIKWLKRRI